jgi:RND family efflux transporter MFP subunit
MIVKQRRRVAKAFQPVTMFRLTDATVCAPLKKLFAGAAVVCCTVSVRPLIAADPWHAGLSEPRVDASLSFPLAGVLSVVRVKEGDVVKAGDVLLELENESERLEVQRRHLAMQAARKEYERTKLVFDQGRSVSREELEQKEATYKIAEVEKQIAEAALKHRQLVAPCAGVIVDLFGIDPGEAITANTPVVRLVDVTQCRFTSYVKGDSKHGFAAGKPVEIEFETAQGDKTMTGTIDFVSPVIDASSGLQQVRAVIDNGQGLLAPGLQGRIRLKGN